jgi:hypothetical protein
MKDSYDGPSASGMLFGLAGWAAMVAGLVLIPVLGDVVFDPDGHDMPDPNWVPPPGWDPHDPNAPARPHIYRSVFGPMDG